MILGLIVLLAVLMRVLAMNADGVELTELRIRVGTGPFLSLLIWLPILGGALRCSPWATPARARRAGLALATALLTFVR